MAEVITVDLNDFAAKGRKIFEHLNAELEKEHKGKVVAIEVESGDYFIGSTVRDALRKARAAYPGKLFHLERIGHRALRRRHTRR